MLISPYITHCIINYCMYRQLSIFYFTTIQNMRKLKSPRVKINYSNLKFFSIYLVGLKKMCYTKNSIYCINYSHLHCTMHRLKIFNFRYLHFISVISSCVQPCCTQYNTLNQLWARRKLIGIYKRLRQCSAWIIWTVNTILNITHLLCSECSA